MNTPNTLSSTEPSSGSHPLVSVILPCRNEANHIETCLQSILAQDGVPGQLEILVADGMSDDGTRDRILEVVAADPRVRLIDNPGRIVSTGLNAAIRAARGSVIIRMDAHTEYAPDYVLSCLTALHETGAENVGGPWVARGTNYVSRAIAAAFQSPFGAGGARGHDASYVGPIDTVYLGCWRKATLERVGLFDEDMVRNQDDELNLRLVRAGLLLWQTPNIKSWYSPRTSLASLCRQYLQYGYWKVRVIQKHGRPAAFRHLVPVCFAAGTLLGPLLCYFIPALWIVYGGSLLMYFLAALTCSVCVARKSGWDLLPVLPLVFFVYHMSYGIGFALGLLDFVVLRCGPRSTMTVLTRPSIRRNQIPKEIPRCRT